MENGTSLCPWHSTESAVILIPIKHRMMARPFSATDRVSDLDLFERYTQEVIDILLNADPGDSLVLVCSLGVGLDDSFAIPRGKSFCHASGCPEEGSRGDSRTAQSRGCTDGREHARDENRESQSVTEYTKRVPHRVFPHYQVRAVLNETLRLFTPLPASIRDARDLGVVLLRSDATRLTPNVHATREFKPERWFDQELQQNVNVSANPAIFTPFASGPRNVGVHSHLTHTGVNER